MLAELFGAKWLTEKSAVIAITTLSIALESVICINIVTKLCQWTVSCTCILYDIIFFMYYIDRLYVGKILEDSKAISDYKIEEKNFVVVMVTKVWDCTALLVYKGIRVVD